MTLRIHGLSLTVAVRTGPLELLDKSRAKSLGFCDLPMAIAMRANVHIIRVISA